MKKILILLLVIVLAVSMVGCNIVSPDVFLKIELEMFQKVDQEGMVKFLEIAGQDTEMSEAELAMTVAMFNGMTFEIAEVGEIKDDTCIVNVNISNVDYTTVFKETSAANTIWVTEQVTAGIELTEEEILVKYFEIIEEKRIENLNNRVTTNVDIVMKKESIIWVLQQTDDFTIAMSGGLELE